MFHAKTNNIIKSCDVVGKLVIIGYTSWVGANCSSDNIALGEEKLDKPRCNETPCPSHANYFISFLVLIRLHFI